MRNELIMRNCVSAESFSARHCETPSIAGVIWVKQTKIKFFKILNCSQIDRLPAHDHLLLPAEEHGEDGGVEQRDDHEVRY